ncbi:MULTISPECIES: anthranilate synthase component I [Hyphomonas]|uniref:Anthranilate synthase component 1 n=1 Tax=Hyphomonas adhaerens TaxID=81029 RepID=A0A3B9GZY8_9PROT|nr:MULTISPECIES: anthranilate synthase component I [Hyphomonas]MBB41066.1 anthranilate synthase component I [Hyphomonas sp.]HAE27766.1 anthranilate synthase component I [Hyphomonas adhaerens]|tara:strand:- start:8494 stop:9921 length:1428 start_codon:yes stop_codon:yes gene_type:complete
MSRAKLIVRRRIGDVETPVGAMLKLGVDAPGSFLFESIAGGERLGRYSFIGGAPQVWFRILDGVPETATTADFSDAKRMDGSPVEALRAFVEFARAETDEDLPPMASGAFGYVGYDMIQRVEPVDITKPEALNVPEALLVIPKVVIVFDHIYQELLLVGRVENGNEDDINRQLDEVEKQLQSLPMFPPADQAAEPVELTSNTSQERYFEIVDKCREYIKAGDIFQVVPSQRFSTPFNKKSISFYRALRRLNPSAFMFHMNLGDVRLVGSSPEILVRVRNGRVAIRPIAGTRPRSGDPVEDAKRAESLLNDPKEIAEHLMLLDLGRNDVGRVAAYGSVQVTEQFIVERYSHVMHIVSHVEGDLREGLDAVDALFAGFPAGTVSGAPKIRAMQIIDEMETNAREIYGGAVGYFGWNGDLDTCIALRTAVLKDGKLHIQAGGGVVLDSDPQYEYDETQHKAGALKRAAELAAAYEFDQ